MHLMGCYMPYLRTRTSKGSRAWNVLVRVAEEVLCCRRCCRCEAAGCRDAAAERRHCGTGSSKVHGKDYRLSGTRGHLVNCLTVSSLNIMDQKTRLFLQLCTSCIPSLRVCKPACYEPDPKPGNREGCSRKGTWRKIPWGMDELPDSL